MSWEARRFKALFILIRNIFIASPSQFAFFYFSRNILDMLLKLLQRYTRPAKMLLSAAKSK